MLNYQEIIKDLQRITKIKPFTNKYNCEGIKFPSEKGDPKKIEEIMQLLLLMFCKLKKKKYVLLLFQNTTQIVKDNLFF